MRSMLRWPVGIAGVVLGVFLGGWVGGGAQLNATPPSDGLPRFTEEREAAALFFAKKHLPELLPLLQQLKKTSVSAYEKEIRSIYQVTELLADLRDDTPRYELELKIWITENKAQALV